jgi:hypothetical protein
MHAGAEFIDVLLSGARIKIIISTYDGNDSQYVQVGRKLMTVPPSVADASVSLPALP